FSHRRDREPLRRGRQSKAERHLDDGAVPDRVFLVRNHRLTRRHRRLALPRHRRAERDRRGGDVDAARYRGGDGASMRRLITGFAIVAPILLLLLWPHARLAGLAILALSHALILYPTMRPNVQWFGPVITGFDTNANEVWLTIDDGPTDDTPAILDVLDARAAKATFFVKGTLVRANEQLVREIVARGHSVANHSD